MNILALIPARGGSKGIHLKNIYPLAGKPLICHTIDQAKKCKKISRIIVTTDDESIAEVSRTCGAEVIKRPDNISGDFASSESALIHSLKILQKQDEGLPDLVVFLQCTSPLRQPTDIDAAIATLLESRADSLLSVSPSHRFLWSETDAGAMSINYDFRNRPRRQDMEPQYVENGSIYVFKPQGLLETENRLFGKIALYKMDEQSAIDIDTTLDMKLAELMLSVQNKINGE